MITVISASYGGYDNLRKFPDGHPDLFGVMVSDKLTRDYIDLGWTSVVHPQPNMHPRMAAKAPKCRPDRFLFEGWETHDEAIVWLDASAHITDPDAFVAAVRSIPAHAPMGQFVHPDRGCLFAEMSYCGFMDKYLNQDIHGQANEYRKFGMPNDWGLWATGMIVYHPAAFDLPAFGNAWLFEQMKWTYQDQISEPYLLWLAEYRPSALPGHLRQNGYVEWMPHTRND